MSRYSQSQVETQYIDPVAFVPNMRCRFELDGSKLAYMPNMRILDIGCTANAAQQYNRGLGCLALIKNIRLMDARTELSSLRTVAPYMFFKNTNHTNSENKSQKSWTRRHQLGLELDSTSNELHHLYRPGGPDTIASGNAISGTLDLRKVFPILNHLQALPTTIFKNLTIEIEFEASTARQILTATDANTIDIIRPVLAVDFIDNPAIVAPMTSGLISQGARWLEIEHDNYVIPAVDTSAYATGDVVRVSNNNNSLGFVGKMVERILVCKQIGDFNQELNGANVLGFSALASSQALLNESMQVRLNGRNVLPGAQGIAGANVVLGQMVDTYGELSINPAANKYKWAEAGNLLNAGHESGQQDWFGIMLGARVQNLQIEIARDTVNDTATKHPSESQLNVNLYGEVHKSITFQNGGYRIVYV